MMVPMGFPLQSGVFFDTREGLPAAAAYRVSWFRLAVKERSSGPSAYDVTIRLQPHERGKVLAG